MPFTPFHLGPAAAIKAAAPRRFSFLVANSLLRVISLDALHTLCVVAGIVGLAGVALRERARAKRTGQP